MWVVALHRVQLVAVVPPPHGVDVPAHHTHAVVGVLLLQRLDGAPAVVTGVVPATGAVGRLLPRPLRNLPDPLDQNQVHRWTGD